MNKIIHPRPLAGAVQVPSSKSMTHRELICAALAEGESIVDNVSLSKDIEATIRCMEALGASFDEAPSHFPGRDAYAVTGGIGPRAGEVLMDCGESGSTLRFLIPIGLYAGVSAVYTGHGRLGERPLTPYHTLFDACGIRWHGKGLPFSAEGVLSPGRYELPGDVSSQFFTGLLFVLPLLSGDSVLSSTTALESAGYIDMTLDCMARHGVEVGNPAPGRYEIPGGQTYRAGRFQVEGDYSQAAFWLAAGLLGTGIRTEGLSPHSRQGDRAIIDILRSMGGQIERDGDAFLAHPSLTEGTVVHAEEVPDLVPVLAALAAVSRGRTVITGAARVRLKECDRLHAMAEELERLGASIEEKPDGLVIDGKESLTGGTVSSWNDHRIAMALAAISSRCDAPLTVTGAECVAKSYPLFWEDFAELGGETDEEK